MSEWALLLINSNFAEDKRSLGADLDLTAIAVAAEACRETHDTS